ncbi:MAG TPA: ABC transporter permease [Anaerolineae bacterium]|nr:ABC transporter permease [Anaerolineae bacterium]
MDAAVLLIALQTVLAATWRMATPLIYTAIGEMFAERAGVLNIGLEGIMLAGALTAFTGVLFTGSLAMGLLATVAIGTVCGLVFALFTVTIKANQIVVGAAFNLIGLGLTGFFYRGLFVGTPQGVETFAPLTIPLLSDLPFLGEVLFRHNLMVYGTLVLVPLATFVLYKTAFGLSLRSVGEHPKAADTVGINVSRTRYAAVIIGAVLAATGGAFLTIAQTNQFVEGITSGRGFIALAIVVFGRWSPWGILGSSLLFGAFFALQLRLQAIPDLQIPYQSLQVLPYLATIIVLISVSKRSEMPAALGVPYRK